MITNPVTYILLVNLVALFWAIRSWKKNIREKWMNNLRDAGAELIGAAEHVYAESLHGTNEVKPQTMSNFIAKEQKVLLLFAHNKIEKEKFTRNSEKLRRAADSGDTSSYRGVTGELQGRA